MPAVSADSRKKHAALSGTISTAAHLSSREKYHIHSCVAASTSESRAITRLARAPQGHGENIPAAADHCRKCVGLLRKRVYKGCRDGCRCIQFTTSTSHASPRSLQASGQSGGAASQPRDKAICVGRALSAVGQQSKCEVQVCACCYHLPGYRQSGTFGQTGPASARGCCILGSYRPHRL